MLRISPRQSTNSFVLLIEDNRTDIMMVKNNLAQSGIVRNHLSACQSIKEAKAFLKEYPEFSIILLSLGVSDAQGLSGLRQLMAEFSNKIIIALADSAHQHLGMDTMQEGAQDFLLKEEIVGNKLHRTIQFAVERAAYHKEAFSEKLSSVQEKNHQLYQDIFNNSKDAIYICNLEGRLVDFNQATFELFAFSEEELVEIEVHDLFASQERKREFLYSLVSNQSVADFSIEIAQKNGKTRQCLISASMIRTSDFTGYSGVLRDITEQQKGDELKKARDIARQSAKMKEQFIANISHEMRTPMTAILGMSNLVMETQLSEEQYNYISSIKQSSELLLGVVNDILAISEIQSSQLTFNYTFFNLHELLQNLLNVTRFQSDEKHLQLLMEIGEDVPKIVHGDKLRLNQILYNLVLNGIKFTEKGSVKIVIENQNQSNDFVQLKFTITDTGIGIPSDKIDAIFETFTLIREQGMEQEGKGLGLPIAKNLVEQQGGKIGVESQVGKGSSFYFDLLFEVGEEVFPETIQAKAAATLDKGAIRVLLVEDHKMNQLVAIKTLEKHWSAIEITVANDGKEAVEILENTDVDIILMDIQMPNMNGYEATAYIRHKMSPRKAEIPILAMTAHAHVAKNEKFRKYGMDDCIIKPFEPKELYQKITEYTFNYKVLA
ncbi:MAG: response regulator [Bacteroidota bacterium]